MHTSKLTHISRKPLPPQPHSILYTHTHTHPSHMIVHMFPLPHHTPHTRPLPCPASPYPLKGSSLCCMSNPLHAVSVLHIRLTPVSVHHRNSCLVTESVRTRKNTTPLSLTFLKATVRKPFLPPQPPPPPPPTKRKRKKKRKKTFDRFSHEKPYYAEIPPHKKKPACINKWQRGEPAAGCLLTQRRGHH